MARGKGGGRRGWILFIVILVGCVAALGTIAFLPAPSSNGCPNCQGRDLSNILVLGPGTDQGSPSSHLYCFPVDSVSGSLTFTNLDVGIASPSGSWVTPDDNWSAPALNANGQTVATYHFSDFNGTEGPLWVGSVESTVTQGFSFCLASQSSDLGGLSFVLVGVGFDPTGQVSARIP